MLISISFGKSTFAKFSFNIIEKSAFEDKTYLMEDWVPFERGSTFERVFSMEGERLTWSGISRFGTWKSEAVVHEVKDENEPEWGQNEESVEAFNDCQKVVFFILLGVVRRENVDDVPQFWVLLVTQKVIWF